MINQALCTGGGAIVEFSRGTKEYLQDGQKW